MKIHDLEGVTITVTDLKEAIRQAALFKDFEYADKTPEAIAATKERQRYWNDIHEKLLQLQLNKEL